MEVMEQEEVRSEDFHDIYRRAHNLFGYKNYKMCISLAQEALELAPDSDARWKCESLMFEANQASTSQSYKTIWTTIGCTLIAICIGLTLWLILKYAPWFITLIGSTAYVCSALGVLWWVLFVVMTKAEKQTKLT